MKDKGGLLQAPFIFPLIPHFVAAGQLFTNCFKELSHVWKDFGLFGQDIDLF